MTKPEIEYLNRYLAGISEPTANALEDQPQLDQDSTIYIYPKTYDAKTEHQIHFSRQSIDDDALRRGLDSGLQQWNVEDWHRRLRDEQHAKETLRQDMEGEIHELRAEIIRLTAKEQQLESAQSTAQQFDREKRAWEDSYLSLEKQLAARNTILRQYLDRHTTLTEQGEQLRATIAERNDQLNAQEQVRLALRKKTREMDLNIQALKKELTEKTTNLRELRRALEQAKQETTAAMEASDKTIHRLQTRIDEQDNTIRSLHYRAEKEHRIVDEQRVTIETLTSYTRELESDLIGQRRISEEILSSRTWRATAPARWFGTQIKRGLGLTPARKEIAVPIQGAPVAHHGDGGPLRILMVIHQFLPHHAAGSEIYTYRLAKALARHHDIHLVFTEARPGSPAYQTSEGVFDGLPYTEISHNHFIQDFDSSYRDPKINRIFSDILDRFRPDLVHFQHLHYLSIDCIGLAADRGMPVVYTLHDYMLLCPRDGKMLRSNLDICDHPVPEVCADCLSAQFTLTQPGNVATPHSGDHSLSAYTDSIERRLDTIRRALARVDLFISPSRFLRQKFIDTGLVSEQKIIYSENGLDLTPFRNIEHRPSEAFRLGYIGTISEYKGVHVLVEAMNKLRMSTRLECHIHGSLEYFPSYVAQLREQSSNPRTIFHGAYENHEIGNILANFDMLVVPSIWYENAPLTIQEANAAGVPLLASDLGGMKEFIQDHKNGFHFRVGDADDLARQIENVYTYPELVQGLSPIPVKSIEEDAEQMENRYRRLLADNTVRV